MSRSSAATRPTSRACSRPRIACAPILSGREYTCRGLVEFSNICRRDCLYCGLRRSNRALERYRLSIDDIIASVHRGSRARIRDDCAAKRRGSLVLHGPSADAVRAIKRDTGLAVTLSAGERDEACYRAWKEAGADRVLVRIETTDPELFARLHPDGDLSARMACLRMLKSLATNSGRESWRACPVRRPPWWPET